MKFFAVFAAIVAITAAAPGLTTQWTLHDLSEAIQNPTTPAELMPYLEHALNTMMEQLFAGQQVESIVIPTPVGLLPVEAIGTSPAAVMPVGVVDAPVVPGSTNLWTLNDLSEAIQNPATPAEFLPYIEHALNIMMEQLFAGQQVDSIAVLYPGGFLPVEAVLAPSPAVVMPVGVVDAPVEPSPAVVMPVGVVEAPVAPIPAVINDASGSPLVQIIVNIKSKDVAETPAPVEAPVLTPEPVLVVDEALQVPEPVVIAPAPAPVVIPEPVVIAPAPAPIVIPEPIVIAPAPAPIVIPENPIDIIAIGTPENPIDVIAIGAPEVNPIDLLQPMPVAVAGAGGQLV